MKTIHLHPFITSIAGILLAAASPAQTPVTGSIGMTVKNSGPGSSILWLAPEPEKVLGFNESGQLTVLAVTAANETEWGSITGTLAGQADLQSALNAKAPLASPAFTGTVIIPPGASIAGYLTETEAAASYASLSGSYSDPPWITSLAKSKVGLGSVENTALSTWTGGSSLTTVGTITAGIWQGTVIADSYIASASTWNSKAGQEDLNDVATLANAIDVALGDLDAASVKGPAIATDHALARFDTATGKLIQSSDAILSDSGALTLPGPVSITGGGNALSVTGNVSFNQFSSYPHMSVNWPTNAAMTVSDAFQFIWSFNGSYFDGGDAGIKRAASGVLKITDGSTGYGSLDALAYQLGGGAAILSGSGTPEGSVTSSIGSLYTRTDGAAGTTLYIKESGTGNTGWIGIGVGGGSTGTVTSVAMTVPTGLTVTGSPVTTSGTLALAYDTGYTGYTTTEQTKLSGIETAADVTDATNVAAAGAVMNTGNETVEGIKTFSSSPVVPAPTTDFQAATKKYVDDNAGGVGGGIVLQRAAMEITSSYSATGITPSLDGTIPQRSELADLDMELSITPTSATSELWLEVYFNVGCSSGGGTPLIGVFQTGTDDAKTVFVSGSIGNTNYMAHLSGIAKLSHPGAGVATTVEFRLGMMIANASIVAHINRINGSNTGYGAATVSTVRILEIEP